MTWMWRDGTAAAASVVTRATEHEREVRSQCKWAQVKSAHLRIRAASARTHSCAAGCGFEARRPPPPANKQAPQGLTTATRQSICASTFAAAWLGRVAGMLSSVCWAAVATEMPSGAVRRLAGWPVMAGTEWQGAGLLAATSTPPPAARKARTVPAWPARAGSVPSCRGQQRRRAGSGGAAFHVGWRSSCRGLSSLPVMLCCLEGRAHPPGTTRPPRRWTVLQRSRCRRL